MTVHPLPVPEGPATYDIPAFEGKTVHTTKLRLSSAVGLDIDNAVLRTDDIVRVVVEARVTGVDHRVNERTGELERIQTAKALELSFLPWDAADPTDDGVVRR